MDIKVVYDPKKGNEGLHSEILKMIDGLELPERLVTVYHPKSYKGLDERFELDLFIEIFDRSIYSRFVQYGE